MSAGWSERRAQAAAVRMGKARTRADRVGAAAAELRSVLARTDRSGSDEARAEAERVTAIAVDTLRKLANQLRALTPGTSRKASR